MIGGNSRAPQANGGKPIPVTTTQLPLDAERRRLFDRIVSALRPERLRDLLAELVSIPSPTGDERAIVEFMASHLEGIAGLDARMMQISDRTANVHGTISGSGDGANLLLYSPIDTHIEPNKDVPWIGAVPALDTIPQARVEGDLVLGLGASNPKCMVAGLTEVVHAVSDAGIPLRGDLSLAFAGGGMPWIASERDHVGFSSGVTQLMLRGVYPDFCLLLKPRWGVFAEEPGLAWFKVNVRGTFGYAGITRGTPGFRSSIVPAATVVQELEEWLPPYTNPNADGAVLPEGWISSIRSGDPDKPAFPAATTEIYIDMRLSPRTSPADVRQQFGRFFEGMLKRHPEIDADWEMYGSMPGGATPFDNWIVQSAQRGWEQEEGAPYLEMPLQAGQTDGTMIPVLGVPTARVGFPWGRTYEGASEGLGGMGVASVEDTLRGARVIAYSVVDTLTRSREELGL